MAGKNTVSISFIVEEGKDGLKKLTMDATSLKKIMEENVRVTQQMNNKFIDLAAICTSIDSISNVFNNLQSTLTDLSQTYNAQIEAETKLAVNMHNTMDAREEDIESIKRLCSAQQDLGVIGDEVQLAGAQELATYLSEKKSLERLIPVMNDMLAQQYGLNATQENAAQIATMLGKVMDGQTGALSRYGYSFDDAQEQILKYGTEAQRAATLVDVVSASVGGMNAALAQTDGGRLKQMDNTLGDIKEKLGSWAQTIMPFTTMVVSVGMAVSALVKLTTATKTAYTATKTLHLGQKLLSISFLVGAGNSKKAAQAMTIYSSAAKGSAASTKALTVALRGMLISTGIGIAIAAVTYLIYKFTAASLDASDATDKLISTEERAKRNAEQMERLREQENSTLESTRASLQLNISKLKEFNGTKAQEKKLVSEMNSTYGETMGYFSSVADWYKALVSNSEAYCRQMVIEARTRTLANQIAAKEQENHDIIYDEKGNKRYYKTKREKRNAMTKIDLANLPEDAVVDKSRGIATIPSELDRVTKRVSDTRTEIKALQKQMNDAIKEANSLTFSVKGRDKRPDDVPESPTKTKETKNTDPVWTENPKLLKEYEDNIKILDKELQTASIERAAEINKQKKAFEESADAIRKAGIEAKETGRQWINDAVSLKDLNNNLQVLNERLDDAKTDEEAASINKDIAALQKRIEARRKAGIEEQKVEKQVDNNASTLKGYEDNISALEEKLQSATLTEAAEINKQIEMWQKKADAITNAGKAAESTFGAMRKGWDGVKGIGGGVESLTSALEDNGNAWQTITGIIDGFLQIYDGIAAIVGIINTMTEVTNAHTTAEIAEAAAVGASTTAQVAQTATAETGAAAELPVIAANKAATASFVELAAAEYMAAHAEIPFAGFGIASGFAASAAAMVQTIGAMPFANGGIVSGPTIGLIGEYAGASNNPEVVAPLDKLRSMLQPSGGIGGRVTFEIEGRKLVGVIANETRISSRSGKRSNIKI